MAKGATQATKPGPGATGRAPAARQAPGPAVAARGMFSEPGAAAERAAAARSPRAILRKAASMVREVLAAPGSGLDEQARAVMESRFGHDFSAVRIHTGSRAGDSARAVGARAYTVGSHIVFSDGSYAPGSDAGKLTLAHELTHVIQQRQAPVDGAAVGGGLRISHPTDRLEREADRVARQIARPSGDGSPRLEGTTGTSGPHEGGSTIQRACDCGSASGCTCPDDGQGEVLRIQRFASAEHVRLGDEAEPGQNVLVTGFGPISYGEMNALGDYFSSISEIESLVSSSDGRAQVSYALWKVNPAGRPCPASNPTAEQEVEDRYNRLAAHNETHFSTGSSAGNSNREQYIARHREALRTAWFMGLNPLVVRRSDWQAQEAFAAHFLTDAFAAGHVRTQRGAIQGYWEGLYPNFREDLVTTIACHMASYINDRDTIGWLVSVDHLTGQIAERIRAQGGTRLSSFSIGDLISKVLHDADNAGLDVVSPQGPAGTGPVRWRAVGDEFLFPRTPNAAATQTALFAETAIRRSFAEGQRAERAGRAGDPLTPLLDESSFAALVLLPAENTASSTNPTYVWRVSGIVDLPANIKSLIKAAFDPGHEVRNGLRRHGRPDRRGHDHLWFRPSHGRGVEVLQRHTAP